MVPLAIVWLFPIWMMLVFSTMPENGIFSPRIELLPSDQFWSNFRLLQADTGFLRTCSSRWWWRWSTRSCR